MRLFWIIVAILTIAALIALMRTRSEDDSTDTGIETESKAQTPPAAIAAPALAPLAAEPAGVTRIDARTIQLDGRFDVSGTGSTSDPYIITWPLMMSAQNDAAPEGTVILPKYISVLDGTSIEISGYLAPPVACDQTNELLVMRNRWDGCCIGTPPTPFDCIEVRLDKAVSVQGKHLIQYGTIRGILRVEPFSAGKYLLGLYRIEHGQVDGFGG